MPMWVTWASIKTQRFRADVSDSKSIMNEHYLISLEVFMHKYGSKQF